MADSLLQAMERKLDARIRADGRRAPRHQSDESGAENSDGVHDHFTDSNGGGRWARHHGQDGGRAHGCGCGHRVRFDDEEFDNFDHEEGSDENPFANDGLHRRRHDHRRHAHHGDREHHHGRRNR